MYTDAANFTGNQTFTALRFTYGASGAITLNNRSGNTFGTTGLTSSSLSQGTVYTVEIVANNKSSGTISYSYNGNSTTVAVQKFDLYINGTLVGDDLARSELPSGSTINAATFIGLSSTSNVANIFVDDFVVYNAVPATIGASAPTVTSSAATSISATGATLNGNVTADGGASLSERGFYTKISSGVTTSDTKRVATGTATGAYTLDVTGLSVNTRYYFKSFASNSVGPSLSSTEQDFWTLANAPSAPTLSGATATGMSVAIGSGDGNPSTTQYAIQTTNGNLYVQADGTLGASAVWQTATTWGTRSVSGLTSSTSYTWQLKARNGANTETAFGTTASLSTSAASTPTISTTGTFSALSTFVGTASSSSSISISSTALTADITATRPSAEFEVSSNDSTWGATATFAQSGGVVSGTLYVRLASGASVGTPSGNVTLSSTGASSVNAAVSGTVNKLVPTAHVTSFGTGTITTGNIPLTWTAAAGSPDGYLIRVSSTTVTDPVNGTPVADDTSLSDGVAAFNVTSGATTSYSGFTGFAAGTTYTFKIYPYNNSGASIRFRTDATVPSVTGLLLPAAPATPTFASVTAGGFTVNWAAVTGAASYLLDVSTASNFATFVSGYENLTVNGASQAVTGLSSSTTYYARVRAVNTTGTSADSTAGNQTTQASAPANDLSSAPTSITVNGGSVSGTTLAATLSSPFTTTTGSTDVWFSLTAPATGTITIATSATAQDLDLTVWSGSAPSATTGSVMTNGATSSDTTSESGTFPATLGTVYYIRVLKYSSTDTAGSFTITAAMNGPYLMSSGNYSQNFADIANWGNNFASGTGAANYSAVAINGTGTIPDGVKTTVSSATFTTGTSGGVQKGTGNLQFLSTGSNNATAVDLLLDFTGRTAGTITFDWACVFNSTGNRGGTLSVYTSTDGTTWTLLSGTSVSVVNNVASSGTVSTVQLPSSFNNNANARVRFYQYADAVGTTGSRPKISIDNLAVTSTAVTPSITIGGTTSGTATAFTTTYGTESAQQSFTIAGSNLTADISVGAVTGLEYSINSGSTWGTTQTITRSGTSASATLLVRLAATAVVGGSYDSQAIPLSSTGATTRYITTASAGNSVSKATPTISVAPTASAITYGQTLASSSLTGGTPSTPGTFAFTTPSTAPSAGTASQNVTFTPTDGANYNTASTTASVTVNPRQITVTADAKSKTYGVADPGLTYAITTGALVVGDSLKGGLSRAPGANVGTYAISSTLANANYDVTFVPANLTITAATVASSDITMTPAGDGSYTASATGVNGFSISYSGRTANGVATSYGPSSSVPTAPGFYTVTATATGNYSGSKTADYFVAGPVAVSDAITKPAGNPSLVLTLASLLANDVRITTAGAVATDGLSITGVTNGSGNSAQIDGGDILFTPSGASPETFTYTLGYGIQRAIGTVTVTTESSAPTFTLAIVKLRTAVYSTPNTEVTHDFIGVPNQTYAVEYSTDLTNWTSAGNRSTGATGSFSLNITKSGDVAADWNAHMFFRARLVR